ncbi:DUF2975 domain-containing protein [Ochrobactrum sp. GPK 3]|uniref:DUF2975 domain-containing protein n=1 Tax=Brucella sp. 22210 TaxID=3453892 RepID=UPI0031385481
MLSAPLIITGQRLHMLCAFFATALPIVLFSFWMTANSETLLASWSNANLNVHEISVDQRVVGFFISLAAIAPIIFSIVRLGRLFSLYARGILFSRENVLTLRDAGMGFIFYAVFDLIATPLFSLLFAYEDILVLNVGFNSSTLITAFLGFILLAIARAMDEARQMNDEWSLTV